MACVLYLLDPKAVVKTLKFSCRFEGNNGTVTPNDK
jgi:hypothetical protein